MSRPAPDLAADRFAALLAAFREGRRTALARAISLVEDERPGFESLLHDLYPQSGRAHRIGVTGPPGAGKSTLTAALIEAYRARGETVGVLAVDPTSPYTGGALLGDRIRMNDVGLDDGVFIRSMATRGSLGGLAITTKEVADVMDAFGFDRVIMETVGVGQSELDIAGAADSTVVVLVPESGDSVQALKAGLMEIADLFVVNKADRPGSQRLARDIEMMLHLRDPASRRRPRGMTLGHHGAAARQQADAATRGHGDTATVRLNDPGQTAAAGATEAVDDARSPRRRVAASAGAGEDAGDAESPHRPIAPSEAGAGAGEAPWPIPVLETVAVDGKGVAELVTALDAHKAWAEESGALSRKRRERLDRRVREAVSRRLNHEVWRARAGDAILQAALPALEAGESTPYEVAARIVRDLLG
jgi:LAO/AO transport system kinase